ncbi:MAG: thioredoxin family protein [Nannocystaceae bacterium]|nr:thioredoxin family protein [bacterium]
MRRISLSLVLLAACETEPAKAPPAAEAPAQVVWVDIDSGSELAELAADAATAGKGLMLDVRAQWCVPCKQLESETFRDPAVAQALRADFVTARLDVTDPSAAAEALQMTLGAAAMPWVGFWTMTDANAQAFARGEVPPPAKTISTYVSAAELLAGMPRADTQR